MRNLASAVLVLLIVAVPAGAALNVGDKAPPLVVTDWVKGKPYSIADDGKGKVTVLEFWATWCGPCIQMIPETNELYHSYKDQGLMLIGVTDSGQGQTLSTVQEFVNRQGSRMDYPIAYDRTQKTWMTYVIGTGSYGIPHAVVIGKDGRIVWFGHPGEPEMKSLIRDLLLDRYDPQKAAEKAALEKRLAPLLNDFNMAAQQGNWDKCLQLTDAMLDIDPANFDALRFTVVIYLEEVDSITRLRQWVEGYIKKHSGNAEAMATLASLMLAMPEMPDRQPDLAVKAADLARKADSNSPEILEAVAQVYFQIGDIDSAIRYQRQAADAADKLSVDHARNVLKFYQECKSLQSGEKRQET